MSQPVDGLVAVRTGEVEPKFSEDHRAGRAGRRGRPDEVLKDGQET